MALSFVTSANISVNVVATCDASVECTDAEKSAYLSSGDLDDLSFVGDEATTFTLKALSPSDREDAEQRAGAYKRSELGRLLWTEAPLDKHDRARWHHELTDDEREAMSDYQAYLERVYVEMLNSSLTHIDGKPANADQVQLIRPDAQRALTISELVVHIQRISLLGTEGKLH